MQYSHRLDAFFATADLNCPLTGFYAAFENLVDCSPAGFKESLEKAFLIYQKTPSSDRTGFFDVLLTPCLSLNPAHGSFFGPEFKGDLGTARRVVAGAAMLYMVGWKGLPTEARSWCQNLLQCSASPHLSSAVLHALLEAKSFAGSLVLESKRPAYSSKPSMNRFSSPNPSGSDGPSIIDPFIGL